ncbi:diacylglycerol O-acyltransferase Dga1 [Schizosaccharomyces japonicus yFS275]|uniref:Diacylglycerol O-acyltransferase n=1 Tax=Schizosaccharomyces japonicus (strain yFS275 / FY16936) TaxID=402676 RepID=B6K4P7_SCHJY|nr:diacylglycerol O-acyltransferase Dga1 [Schizosaccharomyces japonicus yFS275]EEB08454.1 diacylglycerol O-acyltransferase Dga1 [Schizosaccharomyces japonicus yFS275]
MANETALDPKQQQGRILASTPPSKRRSRRDIYYWLESLAVFSHSVSLSFTASMYSICWTFLSLWPLLLIYLVWMIIDKAFVSGRIRTQMWLRKLAPYNWFCNYFPIRLHKTAELDPNGSYIFGYHPHGILSLGAFGAFGTEGAHFSELFPGLSMSVLTLNSNFYVPLYRDYLLALGVMSVSRSSCVNLLKRGNGSSVLIVIGGAQEKSACSSWHQQAYIYDQVDNNPRSRIYRCQAIIKRVAGFTIPLFYGQGFFNRTFGLMPWRKPINIVVGEPLKLPKKDNPTYEELDTAHTEYIRRLRNIWDTYKDEFLPDRNAELELAF